MLLSLSDVPDCQNVAGAGFGPTHILKSSQSGAKLLDLHSNWFSTMEVR